MKNKLYIAVATLLIAVNANSASLIDDKISEISKKYSLENILGGTSGSNSFSLDFSSFGSSLSLECDFPKLPTIPTNICDKIQAPSGSSFFDSLDLGMCKVTGGADFGLEDNLLSLANDFCSDVNKKTNSLSFINRDIVSQYENASMKINSEAEEIFVESAYTEPRKINLTNTVFDSGLSTHDIYNPKNGVLGFDSFYEGKDSTIPKSLSKAYFENDYKMFRMYDRFVKSGSSQGGNKTVDLKSFEPKLPETYLEYTQEVEASSKNTFTSLSTLYTIEKKLKREVDTIKSESDELSKNSSSEIMKLEYHGIKNKMLEELFKDEEDKELQKSLNALESYELAKFNEEEEDFRIKNAYLVNPSQLRAKTLPTQVRSVYVEKASRQLTQEARRKAEKMREIKNKQELLKLMAQKVFISNLEFRPEIAEKEIEEILTQN